MMNIYSLGKKKTHRETERLRIYGEVLKKCHNHIRKVSQCGKEEPYTLYTIPYYILGHPIYDIDSCNNYIIQQLSKNGFKVMVVAKNLLFISWAHIPFSEQKEHELDFKLKQYEKGIMPLPTGLLESKPRMMPASSRPSQPSTDKPPAKKPTTQYRPVHDVPDTEKYLMT